MAKITQVGIGRKSVGTIDGITYYVRGGVTYARSTPTMPVSAYNTPEAKLRQAIFKLVQMHARYHLRTIRQTFTSKGNGTPSNRYISINYKALSKALAELAEQYCAGEEVSIVEVEAAISAYAAAHPQSITIGHLSGYQDVFLTGDWPETITLNALAGDSTVIIIVNEHGEQTTIAADGTISVGQYAGGGSNGSSGSSSGSNTGGNSGGGNSGSQSGGDNSGSQSGGDNTGDGSDGGDNPGGGDEPTED